MGPGIIPRTRTIPPRAPPIRVVWKNELPESARKTYEDWHFAPAVRHDDLIFVSGVVGQGESAEEEFRNAWESLGGTLAEAGVGYEDIIDTTIYMVDLQKNAGAMAKAKDEFVKEPYPASTWIGITELVIPAW